MRLRTIPTFLHSADLLIIGFLSLLSVINLLFQARIPQWRMLLLINALSVLFVLLLAYARSSTNARVFVLVHDWYVAPAVFISFKELYLMIRPIHLGHDYDGLLIAMDQWLFGVNPTEWLARFAHPVLTEVLQIAYTLFYFLFLLAGYELYRRRTSDAFHYFMFTCVYGFFLSYLGYFLLPAVGPRFTLHDFAGLDRELPGLWLTPYLRWFVNWGESIPMGVPNEIAIMGTQRDVFPSGHTMMTLVLMVLSARLRIRTRYVIYVTGALLIVATVYQRYHYVIDLVAGVLFMLFCVWTAPKLYTFFRSRWHTLESRLPSWSSLT